MHPVPILAGILALGAAMPSQNASIGQTPPDVTDEIEADFLKNDVDGNGMLNQGEFSHWVRTLRVTGSKAAAPTAEADLNIWTITAFTQADTDRNRSISKEEMRVFLSGSQ